MATYRKRADGLHYWQCKLDAEDGKVCNYGSVAGSKEAAWKAYNEHAREVHGK